MPPPHDPFQIEPDPDDPTGSQAVFTVIGLFSTTDLFSMSFRPTGSLPEDGMADVSWTPNGNGLSPVSVGLSFGFSPASERSPVSRSSSVQG